MKSQLFNYIFFLLISSFAPFCLAILAGADLAYYEAPTYKRFVIIICSRNNAPWVEQNVHSALSQYYPRDKFRVIYTDDNSSDQTADLVGAYVTAHNEWDRFTFIQNNEWQSLMPNHYRAAYLCDDNEIIIHLDGDDFFKHDNVLWFLNKVYNKGDIWLTYGQYEDWPNALPGFSKEVPHDIAMHNRFRELGFWYSHPRTFYAWLFKKIDLKDLMWRGSFIPTTPNIDYMIMFPMIEMAGQGHFRFISDILYLYNRSNALSTCNMPIQLELAPARSWQPYQPLLEKDFELTAKRRSKKADLIIYSCDDPDGLNAFIAHQLSKIKNVEQIVVLYKVNSNEQTEQYEKLNYPNICMLNLQTGDYKDYLKYLPNEYCLIVTDTLVNIQECSIDEYVYELERTNAKAFFLGLSKSSFKACNEKINYGPFPEAHIPYRLAFLGNGIAAWQFEYEKYVFADPGFSKAVVIRKKDLENNMAFGIGKKTSFNQFLLRLTAGEREIGLLCEQAIVF